MALNQWFKFYGGEYLSDPKIAALSAQERSCWVTLLSLASISSTPGKVEFLTNEVLLDKSGIPFDPYNPEQWEAALSVLEKFVRMRMINKKDDGCIEICNWTKRQETALTNAERQAKYRQRNEKVTDTVTKVTLDKIREDKNRINTAETKVSDSSLPIRITSFDEKETTTTKRDTKAWTLKEKLYDLVEKENGVRPTPSIADYKRVVEALKRLSEADIEALVEEGLGQGKRTVREALSARSLDVYLQDNV